MSAKPKVAPRKQVDEFMEFRPVAASSRRPAPSATPKLLILSFLTVVFFLSWIFFRPPIRQTVADIKKAISKLGQPRAVANTPRAAASTVARRVPQHARLGRGESLLGTDRIPGPFEVYLLDGNRYIRVDANNRSVLLNMQTGETTWMASDSVAESRR
jgi:hypothetical protein